MPESDDLDSDQWVDRYADAMYRFTLARVRNPEAAEEIVQATLTAAWQSRKSYAGQSSEKSWLFGVLKHKIMDHFRDLKKRRIFDLLPEEGGDPLEGAFDSTLPWTQPPKDWSLSPEKAAENRQLAEVLTRCVGELPDKFQKVFILKEVDGASAEEICKELDIRPTNLWVMMHRARNQLQKCMEKHWFRKD